MTTGMKDSAFRAYEEYVLKDRKLEEGLKSLVEGSDTYKYLKCIDILTKKGTGMSEEDQKFIESYIIRSSTEESKKIALRYDLLKFDWSKTKEEKDDILNKIAERELGLKFHHAQPGNLSLKGQWKDSKGSPLTSIEQKPIMDEVDITSEIEKLYNRQKSSIDFDKELLVSIDFDRLRKEDFIRLLQTMGDDIIMIDSPALYKTLAKWLAEDFKAKKYFSVEPGILRNMTIEQLDKLKGQLPALAEDPTFAAIYMSKKFSRQLSEEENSHLNYKEKRDNLIEIYEYAKKLPHKLSGLRSSLLLEILENGLKLDFYDFDYFMEYLKLPARDNFMVQKVAPDVGTWKSHLSNVQAEHNRSGASSQLREKDKELLTKYLTHFFLQEKKPGDFFAYLDKRFVTAVYDDTLLLSGQKVEFTPENTSRLEKLVTEVDIQIRDQNKEVFHIGEDVSLWIDLKNVPTLFIKIFTINTENYYRKNLSPFKTNINLDGLIATIEKTVEFKQAPQVKFVEELKFPELKGKVGLFVIELIGNGKSSRAVLKIGTLSVISQPTVAGQMCYILDGERNVCNHESTGIWMDNQYFKANVDKGGRVIVPYLPSGGQRTPKAILLHQGLAQLVDFPRMEETYTLNCGFFLLPESVIMGKTATILLRPQLLINGRLGDLSLLQSMKCVIFTENYIDNIPATKTYNNLVLTEKNELLIKFQVGANLKNMGIEFSANIQNISKDTKQTLSTNHVFQFSTHNDDCSIAELYLRMTSSNDYELHVLGKNGEPIPYTSVDFNFDCSQVFYQIQKSGITNEKGIICLGKMKGIKKFQANMRQASGKISISKAWDLPSESLMQYPVFIDIIENEKIEIPISHEYLDKQLYLRSLDQVMTLQNHSSLIKTSGVKGELYGMVNIEGLKSGQYILSGIEKRRITIRVHKGVYWKENPNYILKQYSLLENTERQGFVKIQNVQFEEKKDGKAQMKINIKGATKDSWRVHVLFFKYLPENLDSLSLRLLSKDSFVGSEYYFQKWNNFYLSNRELSSEFRYCFDRRHEERFTGNTLDKPKLLLKRSLLQSTHTEKEAVTSGTNYESYEERRRAPAEDYPGMQQCMPEIANYDMMCQSMPMAARQMRLAEARPNQFSPQSGNVDIISTFQNFLGQEPLTLFNLPANPEGSIIVELDKDYRDKYGAVMILAVDKGSVSHYIHALPGTTTVTRDLSLAKPLSSEITYSEMRTTTKVEKYSSYIIDDITSSDLQIVDSMEKVYMVLKELVHLDRIPYNHWDFSDKLIKWETMGEEEKNKMMSRYTSHELHLFIYKKDPEYFNRVVKGYLQNKMEKTLVDYYLLDSLEEMMPFAEDPARYESLNSLEKSLLIEKLMKGGKKELASTFAKLLRNSLILHKKTAIQTNRIFDTVLSLKMLHTEKEDIASIIDAASGGMPPPEMMADALCELDEKNEDDSFGEEELNAFSNVAPRRMAKSKGLLSNSMFGSSSMSSARKEIKPSLEEMGETKEYAETNYYGDISIKSWPRIVINSEFWADYAEYLISVVEGKPTAPFFSVNFTDAHHTLTEIVCALAFMDLPYHSAEHGFRTLEGRSAELKAASNLIIFKKEVKEAKKDIRTNILVAQRYIDWENRGDEDALIEEFLVNHIYIGQVIITNISSHKLDFDVLVQIPQGSLPIGNSTYQKTFSFSLESHSTCKQEYLFYFPAPGKYTHFPANVSMNSEVVAVSNKSTLIVMKEKTKISEENFREVLSTGNKDLILNFIKEKPIDGIKGFNWNEMYWLFQDKDFFERISAIMKEQKRYEATLWSYSLYHKNDEKMIKEFLNSKDNFKSKLGYFFESSLLKVRPIDSGMRHLDYYPLINPRAHKITSAASSGVSASNQPLILNTNLYRTYKMFILYLIEKPVWDVSDKINLAYYLCLQDRIKEALTAFYSIDAEKEIGKAGTLKLQYDYMSAYLDFYISAPEFKKAREIVANYIDYPVITWRLLFLDMDQQLKECDGITFDELKVDEEERKEISKKKPIATESQLSLSLDGKEIVLEYNNISEVMLKFYSIDLEILFSRTPFLTQNAEDFSFVQPASMITVGLDPKMKEQRVKIPEEYSAKNVVIEANGAGLQKLVTYFSTSLKVQIFENYGEVKVTDEAGKQLPQVYVKTFVQKSGGAVSFYKDGYTDIRGRFDYVSLNASQLASTQKFALFVMSDKHGSLIRECKPPPTTIRPEEDLGQVKSRVADYYKQSQKTSFSKCKK